MERQFILKPANRTARREFTSAAKALRVAQMLGHSCRVGRDPGKPWHVEMR